MVKSILSQQPWLHDPAVVDLPWRKERYTAWRSGDRLAFGLLRTDLDVNPQPPVKRAFDAVVDAITAMGHEVIEWNPPSHHTALALAVG
jgi:amidase